MGTGARGIRKFWFSGLGLGSWRNRAEFSFRIKADLGAPSTWRIWRLWGSVIRAKNLIVDGFSRREIGTFLGFPGITKHASDSCEGSKMSLSCISLPFFFPIKVRGHSR